MKNQSGVESRESRVCNRRAAVLPSALGPRHSARVRAFTLIEVMVVAAMLVFIVLALMVVFNGTQTAFRAGITQTGVQESGRAAVDLIKSDLEMMSPSFGVSNGAVNFSVAVNSNYTALVQSLPGSGNQRTYVVENFFILTRQNRTWTGAGYMVSTNSPDGALYPLYRFSMSTNVLAADPVSLYTNFISISFTNSPPWSHLMDGVVGLRVRAYDTNGTWMQNSYTNVQNVFFFAITNAASTNVQETGFCMFSNAVPASVEVELGVLEDRTLQRAESLPFTAQTNYLAQHAGQVHLFRQRTWIRNVDPSAYK